MIKKSKKKLCQAKRARRTRSLITKGKNPPIIYTLPKKNDMNNQDEETNKSTTDSR